MKRQEYTEQLFNDLVLPQNNMHNAREMLKAYFISKGYAVHLNPRFKGNKGAFDAIVSNEDEKLLIKIGGKRPRWRRIDELKAVEGYYRVYLIRDKDFINKYAGFVCCIGVKTITDDKLELVGDEIGMFI